MILKGFLYITLLLIVFSCKSGIPDSFTELDEKPPLFPDISGATIPVNIPPLHFRFADPSGKLVVLFNGRNTSIAIRGRGKIVIPGDKWKTLMEESREDSIRVVFFSKQKRVWIKYRPFYIHVKSPDGEYLVYNSIAPGYISHKP
jgi:hypothetical protein